MNTNDNGVTVTVKYQIANFIPCVRDALTKLGFSHYAVLRNVNSMLGRMGKKGLETVKDGAIKVSKKSGVNASVNVGIKFNSTEVFWQHNFAEWHYAVAKADKLATIPAIEIPAVFQTLMSGIDSLKAEVKTEEIAS